MSVNPFDSPEWNGGGYDSAKIDFGLRCGSLWHPSDGAGILAPIDRMHGGSRL